MVGSFEVGNDPLSSVQVVEFFGRGFAAPEGFGYNELYAINKLILQSEI